jgi:uncharacterized membrane protein YfcA
MTDPADTVSGVLLALIALAALLYSSVGHGGASGYLAVMALLGVAPAVMKPAALVLNIFVAGLVAWRLYRAGYFNARLLWPFALGSIPLAFVGGLLTLPGNFYRYLVGTALVLAAIRLLIETHDQPAQSVPRPALAVAVGAGLGFVSGLTGVGGGIFLSPLLLFLRWADMRHTAALSAMFILLNSLAGIAGHVAAGAGLPSGLPWMVLAALTGAVVGAELAVRRLAPVKLRRLLGVVLLVAGAKMYLV